jgi:hypothetical protein
MSFSDPSERFRDILDNVERIERYTAGMSYDAFESDGRTRDAVERCLLRISEAAIRLDRMGAIASELCPTIPWADIRGSATIYGTPTMRSKPMRYGTSSVTTSRPCGLLWPRRSCDCRDKRPAGAGPRPISASSSP